MKKIALNHGMVVLVDDGDFDWLNQWKWSYKLDTRYARRADCYNKDIQMHRLIMDTPLGYETDHIDRNKLNNQRNNLRICTSSQNHINSTGQKRRISIYKGVSYYKRIKKWQGQICKDSKHIFLGYFETEKEAAEAYNETALELYGEFAYLNEIND